MDKYNLFYIYIPKYKHFKQKTNKIHPKTSIYTKRSKVNNPIFSETFCIAYI